MKDFKSIKIIHNIDNRIEFLFFAEFFRLCGIYVGEYIQATNDDNKESNLPLNYLQDDFDAELYVVLSGDNSNPCFTPDVILLQQYWSLLDVFHDVCHISQLMVHQKQKLISDVLLHLNGIMQAKDIAFDFATFQAISNVYVSQNLMKYFANIQYYRINYSRQEETKQAFINAYDNLQNLGLTNKTIDYAKLYCASKANVASHSQDQTFVYNIEKLADECIKLIETYPDFSNAWVLRGLIYEYAREYAREAVAAFDNALKSESIHSYSTHMYYWIAKRYEAYDENEGETLEYYLKSYDARVRFRNIYKLAMLYKKRGEYERAIEKFDLLLKHLQAKLNKQYMDPLECEYYYKANSMASYILCVCLKQYELAIGYGEKAVEFVSNLNKNRFFDDLYINDGETYREVIKNRMNLNKIYQYLAVSNRGIGNYSKAQECWDKIDL